MAKPGIPELTQQAIKRAYKNQEGSKRELAIRFGVSESSVKRICKGITPGHSVDTATKIVQDAIQAKQNITIGDMDISAWLVEMAEDLKQDLPKVEPKSKEGVAGRILDILKFYAEQFPLTLENRIDLLISHPDFEPAKVAKLLKERYAQQKAG